MATRKREILSLVAGLLACLGMMGWASSAAAWKTTQSCGHETEKSFEKDRQPQLYFMLDKSGSMGNPGGTFWGCEIKEEDFFGLITDIHHVECQSCSDSDCVARGKSTYGSDFISAEFGRLTDPSSASKWTIAERTINDVTKSYEDELQFGLGLFSNSASNETSPAKLNHSTIETRLSNRGPGGGTYMSDGLDKSRSVLDTSRKSSTQAQATVFVTDGATSESEQKSLQAACDHRKQSKNNAPVYVVGFGGGTDKPFNRALAAAGGTGFCCTGSSCSETSSSRISDICNRNLSNYTDWTCKGAYQANTATALKKDLLAISNKLSCTIDVSSYWEDRWDDPAYGCSGPTYDCLDITVPNAMAPDQTIGARLWHEDATSKDSEVRAWRWSDPSTQQKIVLNDYWCNEIKSYQRSEDRTATIERACVCDGRTAGATCDNANGGKCECAEGTVQCRQSSSTCDPKSQCQNRNDNALGTCTDTKSNQYGTCSVSGNNTCNGGSLVCGVGARTPGPEGNTCDGIDNDCDGKVDEGILTRETCEVPGEEGRCAVGLKQCNGDCRQVRRPVPEICNGIDDDCNGTKDDIKTSWENSGGITLSNLSEEDRARACGKTGACTCEQNKKNREVHGSRFDGSRQDEFEAMVTQTETECVCRE